MSEQHTFPGMTPGSVPLPECVAPPETIFVRAFRRLGLQRTIPEFQVEFRSYAGLRSTIRLHENRARVRLSDHLADAPPLVLEALAEILLAQVFRRRPSREARECYLAYVFKPGVRTRIDEARRRRGRKRMLAPRGRHYDLEDIFGRLNRDYFGGELAPSRLGWSTKRSTTILGHFDPAHQTITISRWLDSPSVPRYLVEYLVFHEMLHMRFAVQRRGHRRVVHTRQFREAEKRFPKFEQARRKLKLVSSRGLE